MAGNHLRSPVARAVRRALATGALALVGAGALLAHAQQASTSPTSNAAVAVDPPQTTPSAAAPGSSPNVLQEVVVTGSLIALSPNDVSISPVTTVDQAAMQKVGVIRAEDALQNLPQFVASQNSGISLASNGTASVDLRGLGPVRTLVLINGRRMGPGGGVSSVPDIDQIPASLIQRVEVLTGGASSVYGADAVAGVVNFIIDTHFTGVKIDGDYSFNQHDNNDSSDLTMLRNFGAAIPPGSVNTGQNRNLSITVGSDFADHKGNATAYFTFTNTSPAVGSQYDDAGCTVVGGGKPTSPLTCGGSATDGPGTFVESGLVGGTPETIVSDTIDPKTGVMRPYTTADLYNYGALSYFQRQMQRYTAGAFVNYNVNENMTVYSETMWANIDTSAQYGPSADFYTPANISCSNPLLNASEEATLCSPTNIAENQALDGTTGDVIHMYIGRRDVEGGPRVDDYRSDSFREVLGVKGALSDAWTYDAYSMVSNTDLDFQHLNNLGTQQLSNALDVVTDPTTGQPACAAALSGADTACLPWNVWQPGGVTQASLKYLIIPSDSTTLVREYMVQAVTDGDLGQYGIKLPTASEAVKVSFGTDYRADWLEFEPDYVRQFGLTSGDAAAPPESGNFHLWEGFMEGRIPILSDMPLAKALEADVGYRYSSYDLGFNTSTYKIGLEWSPAQAFRVRAGYNRAVRAPNIDELYSPSSIGAGGVADPCWGATPTLSQAQCALTGVSAAEYGHIAANPAAQINTEGGGNSALRPEIADTYTLGVVYLPRAIPSLSASVDYYDIAIRDTIEELQSSTILNGCASGITQFCSLIHRGPTGSLWENIQTQYVEATYQNIGKLRTKGVDVNVRYAMGLGRFGGIDYALAGTYVKNLITQPTPDLSSAYDCVGFFGAQCLNPVPHWRDVFTTSWRTPWRDVALNLRWRFIGPTSAEGTSTNTALQDGYYTAADHIPGYNYFDLSATVPVVKGVTMTLGVNNIADKDPPLIPSGDLSECPVNGCNDNTFPGTYDTLGRYVFAHVEAKF